MDVMIAAESNAPENDERKVVAVEEREWLWVNDGDPGAHMLDRG